MNNTIFWFVVVFFFLFLEIGHPGLLYFLSFSAGAGAALIATLYNWQLEWQYIIFFVVTCAAFGLFYFFLKNIKQQLTHRSNLEALIGKKVTVFQAKYDTSIFQAKIAGQIWQVQSVHGYALQEGQLVVIVGIQGCHLKVDTIK
ncbi:MAG: NfeD family protein [Candidatus Chromulinivorax sp.]